MSEMFPLPDEVIEELSNIDKLAEDECAKADYLDTAFDTSEELFVDYLDEDIL